LLDPTSLSWQPGPVLGVGDPLQAWSVDGSMLVGDGAWVEGDVGIVPSPIRKAVIVRPDLTVVPVATPPEYVQTSWTSVSGRLALSFGYADFGSGFSAPRYPHPWALDVRSNTWVAVANPDWISCTDCSWVQPTEGGSPHLEVVTETGVVSRIPDGTVGVFDPDSATWRRVGDAPIDLGTPRTAAFGGLVVVTPWWLETGPPVAVLDVAAGTWSTTPFDTTGAFGFDVRTDGDGVFVQPVDVAPAIDAGVDVARAKVLDAGSTTWRPVTEAELPRWTTVADVHDLRVDELG
jgi:hypothetical protein